MTPKSPLLHSGGSRAPKKPPALGIVAVLIVAACVALCPLFTFYFHLACDQTLGRDYLSIIRNLEAMRSTENFSVALAWGIGLIVSGVGALAGFALSVVAASVKRGRAFGILGIILSFLVPLGVFLAFVEVQLRHGYY